MRLDCESKPSQVPNQNQAPKEGIQIKFKSANAANKPNPSAAPELAIQKQVQARPTPPTPVAPAPLRLAVASHIIIMAWHVGGSVVTMLFLLLAISGGYGVLLSLCLYLLALHTLQHIYPPMLSLAHTSMRFMRRQRRHLFAVGFIVLALIVGLTAFVCPYTRDVCKTVALMAPSFSPSTINKVGVFNAFVGPDPLTASRLTVLPDPGADISLISPICSFGSACVYPYLTCQSHYS